MAKTSALVPTIRRKKMVCSYCGSDLTPDHNCLGHLRHRDTTYLLLLLQQVLPGTGLTAWQMDCLESAEQVFRDLPASEQRIVNTILDHAGVA